MKKVENIFKPMKNLEINDVLDFWFGEQINQLSDKSIQKMWYFSTPEIDSSIAEQFGETHSLAAQGQLAHWAGTPRGCLALIVLLDQMSRNLYRGTAQAFGYDQRALQLCRSGLERGFLRSMTLTEKLFFIHPLEHSESLVDQTQCLALMDSMREGLDVELCAYLDNAISFAKEHEVLIRRFGRFPHRNAVLGRESTPEEAAYLDSGGKRFGQ